MPESGAGSTAAPCAWPGTGGAPPTRAVDGRFTDEAADVLWRNREELLAVLTTIATRKAAADELGYAMTALRGARDEVETYRPRPITELGVFLPSNNILYSYVLFGLIPALYTSRIVIRPSHRVREASWDIHRLIGADPRFQGRLPIEFVSLSQRQFVARCRTSDAVVFNGRPENAVEIGDRLARNALFLSFGSGPNPVVVGPAADVAEAAAGIVATRMYNSGQDCLCPDVVFAHDRIADDLGKALREAVDAVPVGPLGAADTTVAPLSYPDAVEQAAEFLDGHRAHVTRGGTVDRASGLVEPTVLDLPWDASFRPPEFFAPIVCVMRYERAADVLGWLDTAHERRRGMYVSVYGEDEIRGPRAGTGVVLRGQTALEAENGNEPLGGYGPDAGHVRVGGALVARPLLLSAELGRPGGLPGQAAPNGRTPR